MVRRAPSSAAVDGLAGPPATREVVVPEEPRRDGPPGPPRLAERGHLGGVGPVAEALDLGDGRLRARCRRPARRRAGRGPSAGRSSRSTGRCPGSPGAPAWTASSSSPASASRSSAPDSIAVGERAAVARLLAAEPDGQQLGVGQREEARRRERVGGDAEAGRRRPAPRRARPAARGRCGAASAKPGSRSHSGGGPWRATIPARSASRAASSLDGRQRDRPGQRPVGEGRSAPRRATRRPRHARRSRPPAADRTAGPPRRAATPGRSRRATAGGSRPPGG